MQKPADATDAYPELGQTQPSRSSRHHRHSRRRPAVEEDAGICRAGIPGGGRLHGSRQLGHRHRGRRKVRLTLLSVIMLSNLMAILLQSLSARLGIASGRDLAQACRDGYSRRTTFVLWVICEIAIAACDLAEVLGAAIALQLLFGIPPLWGVCLTATDVFLVLYLQNRGFRYVEAIVLTLILGIAGCFAIELWMARPDPWRWPLGLIPQAEILRNPEMLYISIGILGATVMPHNLYLHSSIVQTRMYGDSFEGKKEAIRYATIDSTVALMSALFINAAILDHGGGGIPRRPQYREVADIGDAYLLLNPLLGATVASTLFAVALLFRGRTRR